MTWAGQMGQSRTGQDKSPKAGRPAQGWTSGSSDSTHTCTYTTT